MNENEAQESDSKSLIIVEKEYRTDPLNDTDKSISVLKETHLQADPMEGDY
jgi:hypothetical protein